MRRCIGLVLFPSYLEISSLASWKTSIFRVCNPNILLPPNDPTPIIWLLIQKRGEAELGIVQGFVQKWAICSQRFWPVTGDEVRREF